MVVGLSGLSDNGNESGMRVGGGQILEDEGWCKLAALEVRFPAKMQQGLLMLMAAETAVQSDMRLALKLSVEYELSSAGTVFKVQWGRRTYVVFAA